MVKIGIVGADRRKWSSEQEIEVKRTIRTILSDENVHANHKMLFPLKDEPFKTFASHANLGNIILVSGHCPVGVERPWCHECNRFYDEHEGAKMTLVYDQGGVDSWAEIIADSLGIQKEIYPAEVHQWLSGFDMHDGLTIEHRGYKSRNIQIAKASDVLYVLSPKSTTVCSRCRPEIKNDAYADPTWHHVRNGGCFTAQEAEKLGKRVVRITI